MQPISSPKSLMQVTTNSIRDAIISGELALGSKLSEQRLSDMLEVSRSPVRDALAVLQSEGLVIVSPKRGSFVFTPNMQEVDDLCVHRAIMETAAIKMAISNDPEHLHQELTKAQNQMQQALNSNNAQGYTQGDVLFHKVIIEGCKNRSIIKTYHQTTSPIMALRTHLFTALNANAERAMSEHQAVIDACNIQDADLTANLLEIHIGHLTQAFREELLNKDSQISGFVNF